MPYDEDDLVAKRLRRWNGLDFALFTYPPRRYERFRPEGANATTQLILDFEDFLPRAVERVTAEAVEAFRTEVARIRDRYECRYIVAAPRSAAVMPNAPCETLAKALALAFPFLVHLPGALVRTHSVASKREGGRISQAEHEATIEYRGPAGEPDRETLTCSEHGKRFRTLGGFSWHVEHIPHHGATGGKGFVLVDDVITRGTTSAACRAVLRRATGAPHVVGFLVGRTG